MNAKQIFRFLPRLIIVIILVQTLYFKFTGSEESVYIFTQIGAEPWGRIGSGIAELVAAILLLTPGYFIYGALISLGVILGALVSHLTVLGIEVKGDGGLLFILACVVFVCSVYVLLSNKEKLRSVPVIGRFF